MCLTQLPNNLCTDDVTRCIVSPHVWLYKNCKLSTKSSFRNRAQHKMSGQFHEVTERTPLRNDDLHLQDLRDGGDLAKPVTTVDL